MSDITHTDVLTNGVRLRVAQAGPEDGPLVLLLHGFPDFWYGWRHQIEYLAQAGYRVWAPDQRGYNQSDKPSGIAGYNVDLLAADIVGLIQAAGREKAFVVGHDWGGGVAWWLAIRYPQHVEKLVILNSPHPAVLRKQFSQNRRQLLKSWYMFAFQIPRLPEWLTLRNGAKTGRDALRDSSRPGTFSEADLDLYEAAWRQPGAMTGMINWYRAAFQHAPQRPADNRAHMPTRIIWGAHDAFLSRELATLSAEYCDDAEVIYIEEATHWVQHEEPERVNSLIENFLKA
jgi:pimeloyl-ACP methyl ester carboxylesterase